ncbi:MAG: molybdopterin-dependent oxidoreductase [Burkholderiaceae bacterium]|nr:molybdopterin-dependent oxidoreductase [Burkholderiaceae bacterium]
MADTRSLVNVAWSLQRSDHGEQPFWSAVGLASVLGQVGLPGGGFALAYAPTNGVRAGGRLLSGPTLPQGRNGVDARSFRWPALPTCCSRPRAGLRLQRPPRSYPDIRLVYWAGGNPFHHHRTSTGWPRLAQARDDRRPRPGLECAPRAWPTSCCRRRALERNDLGPASRDPLLIAMKPVLAAPGQARDDYRIFTDIAARLGKASDFTEGRSVGQWLRWMYDQAARGMADAGVQMPGFDEFWAAGGVEFPANDKPVVLLQDFHRDPSAHPLKTASAHRASFRSASPGFRLCRCLGASRLVRTRQMAGLAAGRSTSASPDFRSALHQAAQPARPLDGEPGQQGGRARTGGDPSRRCGGAASPTAIWCGCSTTAAPASPARG